MIGEWKGRYSGETNGEIHLNIHESAGGFRLHSFLSPSDPGLPGTLASMLLDGDENAQEAEASLSPVNPETGRKSDWESIKHLFPRGIEHSNKARVKIHFGEGKIRIAGESDLGFRFESVLEKVSDLPDPGIDNKFEEA